MLGYEKQWYVEVRRAARARERLIKSNSWADGSRYPPRVGKWADAERRRDEWAERSRDKWAERFASGQGDGLPGQDRWFVQHQAKRWREKCQKTNRRCSEDLNADLVERKEVFTHPRCVECRPAFDEVEDSPRQRVGWRADGWCKYCTENYKNYCQNWLDKLDVNWFDELNNHNTDYNNYKTKGWTKRRSWLLHATAIFRPRVRQFPQTRAARMGKTLSCPSAPTWWRELYAPPPPPWRELAAPWSELRARPNHRMLAWERQEEDRCALGRIAKNDVLKSARLGSHSKSSRNQSARRSKRTEAEHKKKAAAHEKSSRCRGHARRRRENRVEAMRQAREEGVVCC